MGTPPGQSAEDIKKKALIRSLGRRPSEDKIALYVRKASSEKNNSEEPKKSVSDVKMREKKPTADDSKKPSADDSKKSPADDSKKAEFLKTMARRSLEVPT